MVSSKFYNYLVVLTVALGSFNYGFSSASIGSIFGLPSFFEYFHLSLAGDASAGIVGAANGLFAAGGIVGCVTLMGVADKIGRIRTIQAICIISIVASIIQTASVHIGMFLFARFLSGVGAGMSNATVPAYQSEIVPASNRGRFVGSHGVFLVLGYAGAGWTGYGTYFEGNPQIQWRLCLAMQALAPLLLLIATPWVPESPRWLVMKGREQQALNILKRLHHNPEDLEDAFALEEFAQIQQQLHAEASRGHVWSLLKKPSIRRRFLTGMFVQMISQSTGILVVNNYQVMLWNTLGLYESVPLLLYGIWLTYATSLNVVSSFIVDRVGRVKLLASGLAGGVVMLSIYTGLLATYGGTDNRGGNIACVVVLFGWLTFYALCIDAPSYIYCSEIFPTQIRSAGVAASVLALFSMTLIYTQVAATAFAQIGWKFYLVFIIVPACGVPILMTFPETKGLTLEKIAEVFGDEIEEPSTHGDYEEKNAEKIEPAAHIESAV